VALSLDRQNRYREQYRAQHPGWRPATEIYENTIRGQLLAGAHVVDVGCGRGGVLEQLANSETPPYLPFGLDPDAVSLVEHRLPALPRAVARAEQLPLPNNYADLLLASWVLEHLSDPLATFREFCRVLKPGGHFIFLTPNAQSLIARLNRLLKPLQNYLVPRLYGRAETDTFPVRYMANTSQQLAQLATQSGFSQQTLLKIEDPTYLAFTPALYRFSVGLTRLTPPVHLVGVFRKK
jgi:ubiquinone/menaquinone biosynthesis C-methylase UbiE